MFPTSRTRRAPLILSTCALAVLAACDDPLDFDLRGLGGGFTTSQAAQTATEDRPRPDQRGVISYPGYQVAVAERGDTLADVAARVGLPPNELGRFNGIEPDVPLRAGEVIALPRRVAEPSPATGAATTGPIQPSTVDVTTLAGLREMPRTQSLFDLFWQWFTVPRVRNTHKFGRGHHPEHPAISGTTWLLQVAHVLFGVLLVVHSGQHTFGHRAEKLDIINDLILVAETKGFEPSRRFPVYSLSRGAPSTTRPRLHRSVYLEPP